jgi:hypothetical protein
MYGGPPRRNRPIAPPGSEARAIQWVNHVQGIEGIRQGRPRVRSRERPIGGDKLERELEVEATTNSGALTARRRETSKLFAEAGWRLAQI